jgi:hypothetical protein
VRWTVLITVITLGVLPSASAAQPFCEKAKTPAPLLAEPARSRAHSVQVTVPAQFDFTLASVTLAGSATGLGVSTMEPTGFDWVAAAAQCNSPRRIFILVVNRLPRGSLAPALTPAAVTLRIRTRNSEAAPEIVQHVDVLANGAPGQDCSALPGRPLFGSDLKPLTGVTLARLEQLKQLRVPSIRRAPGPSTANSSFSCARNHYRHLPRLASPLRTALPSRSGRRVVEGLSAQPCQTPERKEEAGVWHGLLRGGHPVPPL